MNKFYAVVGVSFAALGSLAESDLIGFWDFKDGIAGTSVSTIVNVRGEGTYTSSAAAACGDTGRVPTFSAARPAAYVLDADEGDLLCGNPQSIDFFYAERSTHQGGYIDIPGLADKLSSLTSFTLEYFIKMDQDFNYYDPSSAYTYSSKTPLYVQSKSCGFKMVAPADRVTSGAAAGHAKGMKIENFANKAGSITGAQAGDGTTDYSDGKWHHVAAVFSETDAQTHIGTLTLFLDYKAVGTCSYENVQGSGLKFRLGTGYLNAANQDKTRTESIQASLSCLRVTGSALTAECFMKAVDRLIPKNTVFALNFEEGLIGSVVPETSNTGTATSSYPDDVKTIVSYNLFAQCKPQYAATSNDKRKVLWGADKMWENSKCLWFPSASHVPADTANRQYYGAMLTYPLSRDDPKRNPASWTMESFVKLEATGLSVAAVKKGLIFGKAGNTAPTSTSPIWYPRSAWLLTYTSAGKLCLEWTERPTADYTDYRQTSDYYKSCETKDAFLNDLKWHHVALSYSAQQKTFKLYVDQNLVMTQALLGSAETNALFDGGYPYCFGRFPTTGGFEGWMDEIRLTGRVLEPAEFESFTLPGMILIFR